MALIRQKAAPLFWDSRDSQSVRLFEAISKREIAANSTYWEAKVGYDGLEEGVGVVGGEKGSNQDQNGDNSPDPIIY